jgi:predicted  nucleic acid-binding Zn-ribbon protein
LSKIIFSAELEQLRRETSNLRFEKNELQQTISEMNKSQGALTENHEKAMRKLRNEHQ